MNIQDIDRLSLSPTLSATNQKACSLVMPYLPYPLQISLASAFLIRNYYQKNQLINQTLLDNCFNKFKQQEIKSLHGVFKKVNIYSELKKFKYNFECRDLRGPNFELQTKVPCSPVLQVALVILVRGIALQYLQKAQNKSKMLGNQQDILNNLAFQARYKVIEIISTALQFYFKCTYQGLKQTHVVSYGYFGLQKLQLTYSSKNLYISLPQLANYTRTSSLKSIPDSPMTSSGKRVSAVCIKCKIIKKASSCNCSNPSAQMLRKLTSK